MAKILLVDPDHLSSRKTMEILSTKGHTTIPARSVEDALNILRSDPAIQMVLADEYLPDATGFKCAELMSQDSRMKTIPVIVFLAKVDEDTLRTGLQVGIKDFLAKPWEQETLIKKIEKALPRRKSTILIIEYERIICDRLKYIIELKEFKVLIAMSAADGLNMLKRKRVDVAIVDIGLPGMPGPELIKRIKAAHPHLPVLLITGLSGRLSREIAQNAGADGSINKPFRNIEITEQLRELTRKPLSVPMPQAG